MRVIVCGLIAQYPLGGVSWDYLQYVIGLKRLGVDVYYLEDTGQWPFNPTEQGVSKTCDYNVAYLSNLMEAHGLSERWAYCFPYNEQWFGLSQAQREEVITTCDLLINVSGCLEYPEKYRSVKRLAYVDSDPVFTQLKVLRGQASMISSLKTHDIHFSFGERLANGESSLPDTGLKWHPTRQPIVLDEWFSMQEEYGYTTIMNWTSYKDIVYMGRVFGQKDREFQGYLELPSRMPGIRFDLALNEGKTRRSPKSVLAKKGWHVMEPNEVCPDAGSYRSFIASSRAEWSVAKGGYIEGRSGWFSCRSACYLASGKPVVVQSTGFEPYVPTGQGILSFTDFEGAQEAIREVERNYSFHAKCARKAAERYFSSDAVLRELLKRCEL